MGRNLPSGRTPSLQWLEGVISQWNTNYAGIGLTSASVIDLAQDVVNARAAFSSVEQVRLDSKAKTQDWYATIDATHAKAADMISTVKAFADNSANPSNVYLLAGLTPKDPPAPVPAPETPTAVSARLATNGTVDLSWDGRGPAQTVYEVYRRLTGETTFSLLAVVDAREKSYNDASVPAAQSLVHYQVRAVRGSTASALSDQTTIQFGSIEGPAELGMAA